MKFKSINEEYEASREELTEEQKSDTQLSFYSGILLGLAVAGDGKVKILSRLEEVAELLTNKGVLTNKGILTVLTK